MKGKMIILIVLVVFMVSGCSVSSPSDHRKQEEITHQAQATEGNGKNEAKPEEPRRNLNYGYCRYGRNKRICAYRKRYGGLQE